MNSMDYYEILNVRKNAIPTETRKSYKNLTIYFHPDRNKSPGAEVTFKKINSAYTDHWSVQYTPKVPSTEHH